MNDGFIANLKSFLRNMERNLKYSANDRLITQKPPSGGTGGQETVEGPGYTTLSGSQEVINTDDPRLNNYFTSKELRKNDFGTGLAAMSEDISKKDDMAARKEFKKLHKIMMDEVNANNWMLSLISSGTIKESGIDSYALQKTLNLQKSLLNKANKVRPSLSSDPSALKDAQEIMNQFGSTL
jgi:hypothetical protein